MSESMPEDLSSSFVMRRAQFASVAASFQGIVSSIGAAEWDGRGLGEWTVRELVGHTLRAFSTITRHLDSSVNASSEPSAVIGSPALYYLTALSTPDVHSQVAERGREAGRTLGDDPAATVAAVVNETLSALDRASGAEVGVTAAGSMQLEAFLETRLVELVVHLIDLCDALGSDVPDLGDATLSVIYTVVGCVQSADRPRVLRSLLGREQLPVGFDVWAVSE